VNLPVNTALATGNKSFKGIQFRVGADVPFNKNNLINVNVDFQPFSSMTEVGYNLGVANGASSVGISVGWSHQFIPNLWGQAAIFYDGTSGSFENGSTISEKRLSLSPSLYYFF
jgi:hypothetical protein